MTDPLAQLRDALRDFGRANERGARAASALLATVRKLPPEISTARCR